MSDRILITGLGVVSPIGNSLEVFWKNLLADVFIPAEHSRISATHCENRLFYAVHESNDDSDQTSGRATAFAIRATESALEDAGLVSKTLDDAIVGVALGAGMGNQDLFDLERAGGSRVQPLHDFCYFTSASIADRFQFNGPNLNVSTACSSGGYSVSIAREAIASGLADVMIAGGTETVGLVPFGCFNQMRALDSAACRPFDSNRQGTVGGEGAAILVLESESHWRRRGARRAYAELNESGWSCDGHHVTAPEADARHLRSALGDALDRSGIEANAVDCVVAHGTGTRLNDLAEANAIVGVLHKNGRRPLVFSPKSKLGHSGGAAGAFSCLTGALIVSHGVVPPTANLRNQDPECPLNINTSPVPCSVRHLVVNSYAFGGNNISLVMSSLKNVV